jgi:hypothetical protein
MQEKYQKLDLIMNQMLHNYLLSNNNQFGKKKLQDRIELVELDIHYM